MPHNEESSVNEYVFETSKSLSPSLDVGNANEKNPSCLTPFELSILATFSLYPRVNISLNHDKEALMIRWQQRFPV